MQQTDTDFSRRLKEHILHVFKFTVRFLEEHNLRYVACGGTVLGSVRHQDFIPWDDDIDIYMPRTDYERLLDLKQEARQEGFDFHSIRDKGYYLPFAKVTDMHTTLWELPYFPYVIGVFVDVFPLDNFDCTDEELTAIQRRSLKKFYNFQKSFNRTATFTLWRDLFQGNFSQAIDKLQMFLSRPFRKPLYNNFMRYQKWYSSFDGPKSVCVTQWAGKIFKREWFEDTISLPFADTHVIVPRDYDGYLRCLYGDYMQLPPVEQRVSEHIHVYLNLDEGLTLSEIRNRLKQPCSTDR